MSADVLHQPRSISAAASFSPRPSMSMAPRDDEVLEQLEALRRALHAVGAAGHRLALGLHDGGAAARAVRRQRVGLRVGRCAWPAPGR